jgi:superfamily II DNA or RNA helicase
MPFVERKIKEEELEYAVEGRTKRAKKFVEVSADILDGITLYPEQVRAVQKGVLCGRGLFDLATSFGKTEVYAALLKVLNRPSLAVIGVHKHAEQLHRRLIARGVADVGWVGKKTGRHNVGTIDKVLYDLRHGVEETIRIVENSEILAFDEVHHIGSAESWQSVAVACQARYRFGMSGTCLEQPESPYENVRDMNVIGLLGEVICRVSAKYLIDAGYAVPAEITAIPIVNPKLNPRIREYTQYVYPQGVVRHPFRNKVVLSLAAALSADAGKRILVIVERVSHGCWLTRELHRLLGVDARFSYGGSKVYGRRDGDWSVYTDSKEKYIEEFLRGDYRVLVGNMIYDEAADIPMVTDIVMAAAGRKARRTIQRTGRGIRKSSGKEKVNLWEFRDATHWALMAQYNARKRTYEEEGHKVQIAFPTFIRPFMEKISDLSECPDEND